MDFGLAKQTKSEEQKLTQAGTTLGTPSYMPPEQVKGELDRMGPASDVYSLAVILFEMLTGRLPFKAATTAEVYRQDFAHRGAWRRRRCGRGSTGAGRDLRQGDG